MYDVLLFIFIHTQLSLKKNSSKSDNIWGHYAKNGKRVARFIRKCGERIIHFRKNLATHFPFSSNKLSDKPALRTMVNLNRFTELAHIALQLQLS